MHLRFFKKFPTTLALPNNNKKEITWKRLTETTKVDRGENDDIIKMFTFNTTLNQMFPLMLERAITADLRSLYS